MVGRPLKGSFTTVTYTCRHTADFKGSPPRMGDICTCLDCFQEVHVVDSEIRHVDKAPRSVGANYDPDDWS
jgi:hypothetical protein